MPNLCPQCGASFPCSPAGNCWCMALPATLPVPVAPTAACLCPACLKAVADNLGNDPDPQSANAAGKE